MNRKNIAVSQHRFLSWVLLVGIVLMGGSGVSYFLQFPGLVKQVQIPSGAVPTGMPEGDTAGVMALMQQLQENPNNIETLLTLAEHFTHTEEWARSENFAMRAVMVDGQNPSAWYWLSFAQHRQGRHNEAVTSLEKSVELKKDPDAQYSLGILYAYFLKENEKARNIFNAAMQNPTVSETLKTMITEELKKIQ